MPERVLSPVLCSHFCYLTGLPENPREMKEKTKKVGWWILVAAFWISVIWIADSSTRAWYDLKDKEANQRREEFCKSFLPKDSQIYDNCIDHATDYQIQYK